MNKVWASGLIALSACSSSARPATPPPSSPPPVAVAPQDAAPADQCGPALARLEPVLEQYFTHRPMPQPQHDGTLAECLKDPQKFGSSKLTGCAFTAADSRGVAICLGLIDEMGESLVPEPHYRFGRLAKLAREYHAAHGAVPVGTSATLPPLPPSCCDVKGGKCPVADWAGDPVWSVLGFAIQQPTLFHYKYTSTDSKHFEATAIGDMDCDSTFITYRMFGDASSGSLELRVEDPPPGTD